MARLAAAWLVLAAVGLGETAAFLRASDGTFSSNIELLQGSSGPNMPSVRVVESAAANVRYSSW